MTKTTLTISGIKCDNPDCDYRDDDVKREDYLEYVNKECPKCASILLTQADYDAVVELESLDFSIDVSNTLLSDREHSLSLELDGTGVVKIVEDDSETI